MIINNSESEKRRIIVEEINRNMFVEAGAGAGKTSLIVSRIVNQLKSGIKPSELVAITFTNAATHELKSRIVNEVLIESQKTGLSDEEKENIQNAIDSIDQMHISTIHSFCYRVLKERSLDVGMSMDISLVEDKELERMKKESFVLWAHTLNRRDWEILLEAGVYKRRVLTLLENLTGQLLDVAGDVESAVGLSPVSKEEFEKEAGIFLDSVFGEIRRVIASTYLKFSAEEDYPDSWDDIKDEWLYASARKIRDAILSGDIRSALTSILDTGGKNYIIKCPTQKYYLELFDLQNLCDENGNPYTMASKRELASNEVDRDAAVIEELREFVNGKKDAMNVILGGYENSLFGPYIEYAMKAKEFFIKRLGSDKITNNLLIEKTRELIKNSKSSVRYFADTFRCIYVDEFQDTDHIQEEFIRMLCTDPEEEGRLRDGALFVVGDPKQSIYRFRGAEPEVYFETKDYFSGQDNAYVIELQDNYRSNEQIIEWVNTEFMNKDITPGRKYIPMNVTKIIPPNLADEKTLCGVYYNESPIIRTSGYINSDAVNVRNLILNLVNGGYSIIEQKSKTEQIKRPIRYSDFLILCKNMRGMNLYFEEFRKYGIPVLMDSKIKMSEELYLRVFYRVFDYLTDPYDRLCGISAIEGLVLLGNSREESKELLRKLKLATNDISPLGVLRFLEKSWCLFVRPEEDEDKAYLNMIQARITQVVTKVVALAPGSTSALKTAFTDCLNSEIEHELGLEESPDAVRFMNLHKAKGLEGTIVIWTNRQESTEYRESKYVKGKILYPSITEIIRGYSRTVWDGINKDEKLIDEARNNDMAENIRLEYVAATRAKQVLIFMDNYSSRNSMFSEGFDFGDKSVNDYISERENNPRILSVVTKDYGEVTDNSGVPDCIKEPLYISESPSDFEDENAGKSGKGSIQKGLLTRPVGNIFGNTLHRTFELFVGRMTALKGHEKEFDDISVDDMIRSCYVQAIGENSKDISADETAAYREFLHEAVFSYGKWWYANKMQDKVEQCFAELPFSYFVSSTTPRVWRHGFADLVLKLNDGEVLIIDYKSDSDEAYPDEEAFNERLRGKYSKQIKAYKEAVMTEMGVSEDRIKAGLISFSQKNLSKGEKIRIRYTEIE